LDLRRYWRLFGLIFWSFRLHSKNLTARGVDANFFGIFRSGLRYITDQKRFPRAVSSSALRMLPPGTLVNAIRSALTFVILLECFASFFSFATPDEMPKADKATIKITERIHWL